MYQLNPNFQLQPHEKFIIVMHAKVPFSHFSGEKDKYHAKGSYDFTIEIPGENVNDAIFLRTQKFAINPARDKKNIMPGMSLWPMPSVEDPTIAADGLPVFDNVILNEEGLPQYYNLKIKLSWDNENKPKPYIVVCTHSMNEIDPATNEPKIIAKKLLTKESVPTLDHLEINYIDVQCDISWYQDDMKVWKPTLYATKLFVHVTEDPFMNMYASDPSEAFADETTPF